MEQRYYTPNGVRCTKTCYDNIQRLKAEEKEQRKEELKQQKEQLKEVCSSKAEYALKSIALSVTKAFSVPESEKNIGDFSNEDGLSAKKIIAVMKQQQQENLQAKENEDFSNEDGLSAKKIIAVMKQQQQENLQTKENEDFSNEDGLSAKKIIAVMKQQQQENLQTK